MAYKCEICGKGVMYGHAVSHAKNRIARVFSPNLRKASISVDGVATKITICTKCFSRAKIDGTYVAPWTKESFEKAEAAKQVIGDKKPSSAKATAGKAEKIAPISVTPVVMEETPKNPPSLKLRRARKKEDNKKTIKEISTPEINIDDIVGTK